MAQNINISVRESVQRRLSLTHNPPATHTESCGVREEVTYTGPWDDIVTMARAIIAAAESQMSVQAEAERTDGEFAELRVTTEEFRPPAEDTEEEGPDTGEGEEGEEDEPSEPQDELGSENNPTYTSSSCVVQVPILAHPKFANISGEERRALAALMSGQDENALLDSPSSATGAKRIIDCIKGGMAQIAYSYIARGVLYFNDVSTEVTARWKGGGRGSSVGDISKSAPGGFSAGSNRDWFCTGSGVEKNGNETWHTASYRLSGIGGWDPFLYNSNSLS